MANVAGDDLFLLQGQRNTECVVDHCLLDRVHLRDRQKRPVQTTSVPGNFIFLNEQGLCSSPFRGEADRQDSFFCVAIIVCPLVQRWPSFFLILGHTKTKKGSYRSNNSGRIVHKIAKYSFFFMTKVPT